MTTATFNPARKGRTEILFGLVAQDAFRAGDSPSLMKAETPQATLEKSETFTFNAESEMSHWIYAFSKKIGCPRGAIVRASLIYFASALDPAIGRRLSDHQINRGSLQEVMLLATVRRTSSKLIRASNQVSS